MFSVFSIFRIYSRSNQIGVTKTCMHFNQLIEHCLSLKTFIVSKFTYFKDGMKK